jgi:C-terminal processing protease CtpA/Prc
MGETKSFNEDVSGDFVGIGAEMQKKNKDIMITSPMNICAFFTSYHFNNLI